MLFTFLLLFVAFVILAATIYGTLRFHQKYRMQKYFNMDVTPRNAEERNAAETYMKHRLTQYGSDVSRLQMAHIEDMARSTAVANPTAATVGHAIRAQRMSLDRLAKAQRDQFAARRIFDGIYREATAEAPSVVAGATVRA